MERSLEVTEVQELCHCKGKEIEIQKRSSNLLEAIHPVSHQSPGWKEVSAFGVFSPQKCNSVSDAWQRPTNKPISKQTCLLLLPQNSECCEGSHLGPVQITLGQYLNSLAVPHYQGPGANDTNLRVDISPRNNTK